ncbi:phosphonate metabolism protein/1,5-bisphosphokinase (PRPP-forming) PhnN [Devosia beringensis]|uniref:phosphonate metabolism protein/1,5-bisphosphokinase (PRPP-forming) PhnN n=1 Tax=Devosia beringensis TaxID=2657486 RepID=UPI00186B7A08|nr:phosphonate metabolism protein/1,5-bisphosphokinase (PRPP-forming) PhnN [Devosia beringensis]
MARPLGSLVLVVGPSGVGKKTIIEGARNALGNDQRFVFVQRVVARAPGTDPDEHDGMAPEDFAKAELGGRFCLCWDAHNRRYGLPISVDTDLSLGKVVVASVARHAVAEACAKYPACAVVLVTAEISLRAQRLIGLGREGGDQITARLARESPAVPRGIDPIIIDNSGRLAIGVTALVMALVGIASQA